MPNVVFDVKFHMETLSKYKLILDFFVEKKGRRDESCFFPLVTDILQHYSSFSELLIGSCNQSCTVLHNTVFSFCLLFFLQVGAWIDWFHFNLYLLLWTACADTVVTETWDSSRSSRAFCYLFIFPCCLKVLFLIRNKSKTNQQIKPPMQ